MVFLFQQAKMDSANIAKKSPQPITYVKKETLVIDLFKLNSKLPGSESPYFSNDLAAKQTSMKKIIGENGVSSIALACAQHFIGEWSSGRSVTGIVSNEEYKGFAKNIGNANYNVDLNDLKKAMVAEFQSYFPGEKSMCKQYVEERVVPYLRALSP